MTVDQKLDLLEKKPLAAPRNFIPGALLHFVVESAGDRPLARFERWAERWNSPRFFWASREPRDPRPVKDNRLAIQWAIVTKPREPESLL